VKNTSDLIWSIIKFAADTGRMSFPDETDENRQRKVSLNWSIGRWPARFDRVRDKRIKYQKPRCLAIKFYEPA
jgi:hypothetical protein